MKQMGVLLPLVRLSLSENDLSGGGPIMRGFTIWLMILDFLTDILFNCFYPKCYWPHWYVDLYSYVSTQYDVFPGYRTWTHVYHRADVRCRWMYPFGELYYTDVPYRTNRWSFCYDPNLLTGSSEFAIQLNEIENELEARMKYIRARSYKGRSGSHVDPVCVANLERLQRFHNHVWGIRTWHRDVYYRDFHRIYPLYGRELYSDWYIWGNFDIMRFERLILSDPSMTPRLNLKLTSLPRIPRVPRL